MNDWSLSIGFYPGILIGVRSYKEEFKTNHVFYIPLVDVCFTVFHD